MNQIIRQQFKVGSKSMKSSVNLEWGQWKKMEHDRFMKALAKYGQDWHRVSKYIKTRSIAQVKSHAQKFFKAMSKKDIDCLTAKDNDYALSEIEKEQELSALSNQSGSSSGQFRMQNPDYLMPQTSLLSIFKQALSTEIDILIKELNQHLKSGTELKENYFCGFSTLKEWQIGANCNQGCLCDLNSGETKNCYSSDLGIIGLASERK